MGYKADYWAGQHPEFRNMVGAALLKLAEAKLGDADPQIAKMARAVVQNQLQRVLPDLCTALALDGLHVDSTDAEVDTGILNNVALLKAMVGADV